MLYTLIFIIGVICGIWLEIHSLFITKKMIERRNRKLFKAIVGNAPKKTLNEIYGKFGGK